MKIFGLNVNTILFNILLLCFSTAFKFAIYGVGINLLLIIISSLILLTQIKGLLIFKKNELLLYILPVVFLIPIYSNPDTFKFSSYMYSLFYILVFKVFLYLKDNNYNPVENYMTILKYIIKIYFYVAILQIILFSFNIYFNQIWTNGDDHRINSLATEPSYTGIFVVLSLYSYIKLYKYKHSRYGFKEIFNDSKYWVFSMFTIFASQSGFSIIMLLFLLLSLLSKKNIFKSFVFIIISVVILIFIGIEYNINPIVRVIKLTQAFFSLDINAMTEADHSGSIRIAPLVTFIRYFDISNINTWIGFGINYNRYFQADIILGINADEWMGGGILPSFIIDFGLISTFFLLLFIKKNTICNFFSIETLFIILVMLNSSLNTQLFWFSLMILSINKSFISNKIIKLV